jgi:hypothetical protein
MASRLVTFTDEYGVAYTVDDTPYENRRSGNGRQLGPTLRDERSYDERQIASPRYPSVRGCVCARCRPLQLGPADISGHPLAE